MILRPACEIASTIRSGSFHSKLPRALPSILRHSKRCLTQLKPPSRASCRSRAVVLGLPHRNTWMAGSMVGSVLPARGDGDGRAAGWGSGLAVGIGGAVLLHATPRNSETVRKRVSGRGIHTSGRSPDLPLCASALSQIDPARRADLTAFSAARGVPSGLSMAHQYFSSAGVHDGWDSVHTVMTPIHGAQCWRAYWKALTMLSPFFCSVTANHA